jgi:hypothetical protein
MEQKNDVRKLNQLSARIALLDQKRKEALEELVNRFCDLYSIAKSRRIDVMETEEKYRGAICAVLFAVDELSKRGIAVKRVYWDKYGGLLISLADAKLNEVKIDEEIKKLAKQRKKQDCGWFIV